MAAVAVSRQLGKGDHLADSDGKRRADAPPDLVEEQRQAQRQADVADHLEQARVLPLEIDRCDRRAGALHEAGKKRRPGRVDGRATAEPVRRSGNAAAGKDHHAAALGEMVHRLVARGDIGALRLFRLGEVDGQHARAHFGGAQQHRIGQHQEIRPDLLHQGADDDAVEHAEGMVGDHDERPVLGQRREFFRVIAQIEGQRLDGGRKEALPVPAILLLMEIQPLELFAPGGALDEADREALQQGVARGGV